MCTPDDPRAHFFSDCVCSYGVRSSVRACLSVFVSACAMACVCSVWNFGRLCVCSVCVHIVCVCLCACR